MEEISILAPLAFVVISLMAGALQKVVLKEIKVPYTVGLFVLGMVIGTLNIKGYLDATPLVSEASRAACDIDPDLIINLFLPILIFSAAYELDVHIFRRTLTNATLLAVPGIVISMILTALVMVGIAQVAPAYVNWNWTFALMFGALISATDPVAVVALLGELGVSKRFSTLIDGESMLNDGTGIVLFMLMYAPFTSSVEAADSSPVVSFLVVVCGGLLIGYLLAKAFLYYASRRGVKGDYLLQTSVMILLSYLTFILAQDIFDLSGVIALVAFGLIIAYHSASKLDKKTQHFMKEFWGLLSYIANTLIFIIIGVIIAEKVDFAWSDIAVLLVVYVGINIVRVVMIAMLYPILSRSGYGLSKRESIILTWGALRGALALTLALMVSYTDTIPEDVRRQVLLLTAGIVTMTLVINATTIKWLLDKLGLLDSSVSRQIINAEIKGQLHARSAKYLDSLQQDVSMVGVDWESVRQWLPESADLPDAQHPERQEFVAGLRMQIIANERQIINSLFNRGVISFEAKRKMESALDILLDSDGVSPLDERLESMSLLESYEEVESPSLARRLWRRVWRNDAIDPSMHLEIAYGVYMSQESLLKVVEQLRNTQLISSRDNDYLRDIESEISHVRSTAKSFVDKFAADQPELYGEVATARAQRMLLYFERETIDEFIESGVVDEDAGKDLIAELNSRVPEGSDEV